MKHNEHNHILNVSVLHCINVSMLHGIDARLVSMLSDSSQFICVGMEFSSNSTNPPHTCGLIQNRLYANKGLRDYLIIGLELGLFKSTTTSTMFLIKIELHHADYGQLVLVFTKS